MTSSYTKVVSELVAATSGAEFLPCRQCRSPTLVPMLGQHGGLCLPCYEDYCRSGPCGSGATLGRMTREDKLAILTRLQTVTRQIAAGNAGDPKRWARTLLDRHANGEAIPPEHLRMARRALGPPPAESDTEALAEDSQRRVDAYIRDEYVPGL